MNVYFYIYNSAATAAAAQDVVFVVESLAIKLMKHVCRVVCIIKGVIVLRGRGLSVSICQECVQLFIFHHRCIYNVYVHW